MLSRSMQAVRCPGSRVATGLSRRRNSSSTKWNSSSGGRSRGSLLVFEGPDRSGKGTQIALVQQALQAKGHKVVVMRSPERTATLTGQTIDNFLQRKISLTARDAHLLFSANRQERREEVIRLLLEGVMVIFDRYSYSGVAYSVAQGLDLVWCKGPEEGLVAPDMVVLLTLDPQLAAQREGYGAERYERIELQQRVMEVFTRLSESEPGWLVVDAAQSMTDLHAEVLPEVLCCIEACQQGAPIRQLWDMQAVNL